MKFLSKVKLSNRRYKTPEGYLVCVDSIIARTGKQEYLKSEIFQDSNDDSVIQIDRPKSEVLSPSTIASFENKPLVDEHPDEDVNVDNYRDYAIGFARDVRASKLDDVDILIANLIFTDPEAIAEIESGEKTELSCGYDCDILGEGDNLYQANIRGNHIALCKAGRAGIARIQDSLSKETQEVVDSCYSEKLKDLSPEERSKKIDELIADEIEAIDGYKEAMKYADEADKSIYSTIIAEELKHIIELKALKNENFKESKDSNIKDIDFKYLTEEAKKLKEELNLYKRQIGSHKSTNERGYSPRQNQKNNEYVKELNESINQAIKFLSEGNYNKQAWIRLALNLESWKGELELENICKKAENAIKKFTKYINEKNNMLNVDSYEKVTKDEENKKMRDGALRGIHLKKIRNTLRNEDEDLVEDFLDYMDTRPDLVKEYDDYSDYMVREDFETWKKYKKIKTRDVDTYEEVTEDLEKELKDGSLKNEILKVGQRVHLDPERNKRLDFKLLKDEYEVVGFKYKGKTVKDDPTIDNPDVRDVSTIVIKSKSTGEIFYINRFQLKDSKIKDSDTLKNLAYKFAQMGNYFDRANSANSRKILGKEDDEKIAEFYKLGLEVYKQLEQEVNYLKNNKEPRESSLSFWRDNETVDLLVDGAERLIWIKNPKCEALGNKIRNLIKDYKKYNYKASKIKDSKKYTITFWVRVPGNTPYKETFETNYLEEFDKYLDKYGIGTDYVFINSVTSKNGLEFYGSQNKWTDVRKELYRRVLRLDSKIKDSEKLLNIIKLYKKVTKDSINKKEVEKAINNLGYTVKKWYAYGSDSVAIIDDKHIKMDDYPYFNQQVKKLKKFGFANDIYVDGNEIVFEGAKFNIKDSK